MFFQFYKHVSIAASGFGLGVGDKNLRADSRSEVDVWGSGELEADMDVVASLKSFLPVLCTGAKQQWVGAVPTVTLQCLVTHWV